MDDAYEFVGLINGGFDGDTTGWTLNVTATGNNGGENVDFFNDQLIFGRGGSAAGGSAEQTFFTVAGEDYTLSFDHDTLGQLGTQEVTVNILDGDTVIESLVVPGNTGDATLTLDFTATGSNTTIEFVQPVAQGLSLIHI